MKEYTIPQELEFLKCSLKDLIDDVLSLEEKVKRAKLYPELLKEEKDKWVNQEQKN